MSHTLFDFAACAVAADVPQIGLSCSYAPEELIYAAGLQPVRLSGNGEPVRAADTYLHNNLCPYVRGLFDEELAGNVPCAGIIIVNSCDAMRRLYDVWRQYGRQDFVHILDILRIDDEEAVTYFASQLRELAAALESHFGTPLTPQRLRTAVEGVNESRRLVDRLYRIRSHVPPPVSGGEVFPILLAGLRSPRSDFNAVLRRYLDGIEGVATDGQYRNRPRLLISGSVFHHPQIVELAESVGAVVVAEDICVGHRHYDGEVTEEDDPYLAIARRYVQRVTCSRMKDLSRRHGYLERLLDEFQIDGVIYHTLKFCDLYQYDFPLTKQLFEHRGLPVLYLEGDYTTGSYGQMKTRLQAFVEVLA